MSFVARLFDDQDKKVFDALNIQLPYGRTKYPYYWVVDEEHGLYFIDCGGKGHLPPHLGEPPSLFFLGYAGEFYFFEAWHSLRVIADDDKRVDMAVDIRMIVPRGGAKERIMSVLSDALLECFRFIYKRHGNNYIRSIIFHKWFQMTRNLAKF